MDTVPVTAGVVSAGWFHGDLTEIREYLSELPDYLYDVS